jgi:hypothetical protein
MESVKKRRSHKGLLRLSRIHITFRGVKDSVEICYLWPMTPHRKELLRVNGIAEINSEWSMISRKSIPRCHETRRNLFPFEYLSEHVLNSFTRLSGA